jgi:hypothetical protein
MPAHCSWLSDPIPTAAANGQGLMISMNPAISADDPNGVNNDLEDVDFLRAHYRIDGKPWQPFFIYADDNSNPDNIPNALPSTAVGYVPAAGDSIMIKLEAMNDTNGEWHSVDNLTVKSFSGDGNYCGDGTCNSDEFCDNCSKDCGVCPQYTLGTGSDWSCTGSCASYTSPSFDVAGHDFAHVHVDASCNNVDNLEAEDWVKVSISRDGGAFEQVFYAKAGVPTQHLTYAVGGASTLRVKYEGYTSAGDEIWYMKNLKVSEYDFTDNNACGPLEVCGRDCDCAPYGPDCPAPLPAPAGNDLLYANAGYPSESSWFCTNVNVCTRDSVAIDVGDATTVLVKVRASSEESTGTLDSANYVKLWYSVNGGTSFTEYYNRTGAFTETVGTEVTVNGNPIIIKMRMATNAGDEKYTMKNLEVTVVE